MSEGPMIDVPELPEIDQRGAPAGWQWVWRVEAADWWRVVPEGESRPCRAGAGPGHRMCGRPSVAALNRAALNRGIWRLTVQGDSWWHYCADHLYGRVLVDGVLYEQRLERR